MRLFLLILIRTNFVSGLSERCVRSAAPHSEE
ncbi:hypothetical protein CTAM01_16959 [Colletotrichum tamarilloi]|uniref:Uncharacterized protein n=1 Tax=Colletotrichum tamarilloi TaxID=1209934 RepID=A0ABQ9QH09_9PEZI|nr:uncharacterized protein CTAM01_16959 [Colletotrichum tamarilloi]KAK1468081.1 hypothetical protein CTAM01_16959 [Colletotrichum tamarilloi]